MLYGVQHRYNKRPAAHGLARHELATRSRRTIGVEVRKAGWLVVRLVPVLDARNFPGVCALRVGLHRASGLVLAWAGVWCTVQSSRLTTKAVGHLRQALYELRPARTRRAIAGRCLPLPNEGTELVHVSDYPVVQSEVLVAGIVGVAAWQSRSLVDHPRVQRVAGTVPHQEPRRDAQEPRHSTKRGAGSAFFQVNQNAREVVGCHWLRQRYW
jgi:hypothetical protein